MTQTINLGPEVYVTDPCYSVPTWCQTKLTNVLPGEWIVSMIYDEKGGSNRNAELYLVHKDYQGKNLLYDWDWLGDFGVDSGQAGVFDAASYRSDSAAEAIKTMLRSKYGRSRINWVAYNAFGFDQSVLEANFKAVGIKIPNNWYFSDLLPIVKELYPDMKPNFKLGTVYRVLNNVSEEDYNKWLASQKPEYFTLFPDKDPSKKEAVATDTSSVKKPMAQLSKNP